MLFIALRICTLEDEDVCDGRMGSEIGEVVVVSDCIPDDWRPNMALHNKYLTS